MPRPRRRPGQWFRQFHDQIGLFAKFRKESPRKPVGPISGGFRAYKKALAVGSPNKDEGQQQHVQHDRSEDPLEHETRWT